eukprot:TRINITY_DN9752_c0_g4_i2.p1 TRINITY_DN9752_c0_g4~~TRINITY_DN9752_c0_g4_i2.p1  ORF type:complete len:224 (+),score=56.67 TRINITY_DN9752_c0_g4_i2:48-719(+)
MAATPSSFLKSSEVAAVSSLLGRVEAVDKMAKVGMNIAKVAVSAGVGEGGVARLAKSLADGRSMMRMGQWVKSSVNVQDSVNTVVNKEGSMGVLPALKVIRSVSDMGYKIGDNVTFLSKQGVIEADAPKWATATKRLQFTMFGIDALNASVALMNSTSTSRTPAVLARSVFDCLMVLQGTKWVPAYDSVPSWFPSACGMASGTIAATHLITDAVQSERKKREQ